MTYEQSVKRECIRRVMTMRPEDVWDFIGDVEDMPTTMPYEPTWTDTSWGRGPLWAVYDQSEGFTPAYALVQADNAEDAEGIAYDLAPDRLDPESETLVVREIH